jgi:hypothetical protein
MPREEPGGPSPADLLAKAQALVDAKPAEGGHPLEWAVPAHFLGDLTALAAASLRSPG